MARYFNTEGPVNREDHYCLDPLGRLDLNEVLSLIEKKKYFVLHAPRQTGKTTCLMALMDYLNREGSYTCLYSNIEAAQAARENVPAAMETILASIADDASHYLKETRLLGAFPPILTSHGPFGALTALLSFWASENTKPVVLLLDEIDSLIGDTLISVLRQIRTGYTRRPQAFPQSIILCGVRDVRDYRLHTDEGKAVITGGSAFNIKAESLRLGGFSREEVTALYGQHTNETGQVFEPDAVELSWTLTRGQPWLVNALAYEACFRMERDRDRCVPITAAMVNEAKENLILRRVTHLDQLADKLQEERVRRVMGAILQSETTPLDIPDDDVEYVIDLGLIVKEGQLRIANPIYQEVIPRQLTWTTQATISQETLWYVMRDGRLDVRKLLAGFQEFFREHSEVWLERFRYKEAGPQLLMQAYLQRIVNGGGTVVREYGLGRGRTDLHLTWPYPGGTQKAVIELKVRWKSLERTISDGLRQTAEYLDRMATVEGHLIIFDRTPGKAWEEKIFVEEREEDGKRITVWGM